MTEPRKLLCILAHPDDETLGLGGLLANSAADGVETYLITATHGERGWHRDPEDNPGFEALARIREKELMAAADILQIKELHFLDYIDGELDQANPPEVIGKLVSHIRAIRPQVVITFAPEGGYGHPDHIAISQFASAALVAAADGDFADSQPPHRVSKFYYRVITEATVDVYRSIFDDVVMHIDGEERRAVTWPEWAVTTSIDASDFAEQVLRAVQCHISQIPMDEGFGERLSGNIEALCASQNFVRVYSFVNGGRAVENDLFAGIT
jgi:LmbE family N-acetylglucosaminyl deacetylase